MRFKVHYFKASCADHTVTEEFPVTFRGAFYDRMVELLEDEDVTISKIILGDRKATLLWGGTVELP
jgi:hypothetical protein